MARLLCAVLTRISSSRLIVPCFVAFVCRSSVWESSCVFLALGLHSPSRAPPFLVGARTETSPRSSFGASQTQQRFLGQVLTTAHPVRATGAGAAAMAGGAAAGSDTGARHYGGSWALVRQMWDKKQVRGWTYAPLLGGKVPIIGRGCMLPLVPQSAAARSCSHCCATSALAVTRASCA